MDVTLQRITGLGAGDDGHYFFGYYDRCPWDPSGRYILAQRSRFRDRRPTPEDELVIGLVDTHNGYDFLPQTTTHAWNWQQGCQLRWLDAHRIIFNDRIGQENDQSFRAVIFDLRDGSRTVLAQPVYSLSPDGRDSITLSFSRAHDIRAGYGYAGIPDPWRDDPAPADAGIWRMNLETGASGLILSMAQVAELDNIPVVPGLKHWLDHLLFSPDGKRFIFLHRWELPEKENGVNWKSRLFTAAADGSDLHCLSDHGMVSHFDWRDSTHVLAWAKRHGIGDRYFLFGDGTGEISTVGQGTLTVDGHCSYSPDGRWLLTDTYPDRNTGNRTLLLWDLIHERRIDLGEFYGRFPADVEIRCDLHPRWSRDGRQICIDSLHEGSRQMYVLDVSEAVAG